MNTDYYCQWHGSREFSAETGWSYLCLECEREKRDGLVSIDQVITLREAIEDLQHDIESIHQELSRCKYLTQP